MLRLPPHGIPLRPDKSSVVRESRFHRCSFARYYGFGIVVTEGGQTYLLMLTVPHAKCWSHPLGARQPSMQGQVTLQRGLRILPVLVSRTPRQAFLFETC